MNYEDIDDVRGDDSALESPSNEPRFANSTEAASELPATKPVARQTEADSDITERKHQLGEMDNGQTAILLPAAVPHTAEQTVMEEEVDELTDDLAAETISKQDHPYRIKGWNPSYSKIWGMCIANQQLFELSPNEGLGGLMKLHPSLQYWADQFPGKKQGRVDASGAMAFILEDAGTKGIFDPGCAFGKGVYIDQGRVVVHCGDRLEVDGQITLISDFETEYAYLRRDALPIDLNVPELSDEEGQALLEVIGSMGWGSVGDPLFLGGFALTSLVCGALPVRPALQSSSAFSTGKNDLNKQVISPLQAGVGIVTVNPTGPGLRQQLNNDCLPIWIDESENDNPRRRKEHLDIARYSYDGHVMYLGGGAGKAMPFRLCSSLSLSGINAPIANPADRSRIVSVQRSLLSIEKWNAVKERRSKLITKRTGERLFRRTVNNLHTLLANIDAFAEAIQSLLPVGAPTRYSEAHSVLLAGAHLLVSRERVSAEQALQWLKDHGWGYRPDPDAGDHPATQESSDCLEFLLSYRTGLGGKTVRSLVDQIKTSEGPVKEQICQLGRLGIAVKPAEGLCVANSGAIENIYKGTRWAGGAHRDRLKELPAATTSEKTIRFRDGGVHRRVLIPWSQVALDSDPDQPEE